MHNVSTYLLSFTKEKIEHNWFIPTMQFSYFPLNMQFLKTYFQCFFCIFGFMFANLHSFQFFLTKVILPFLLHSWIFHMHFHLNSNNCLFFNFHKRMQLEGWREKKTIWSNKLYEPWKIKVQKFTKQSTHISLFSSLWKNANNFLQCIWNGNVFFFL